MALLIGSVASSDYAANATHFDASADYLSKATGFTGATDGKTGMLSVWMKFSTNGVAQRIMSDAGLNFILQKLATDTIRIQVYGTASMAVQFTSSGTITDTNWHHFIMAWDSATAANNKMYIDGVDATVTINSRNDVVGDYTLTNWQVSAATTGSWTGDICELYFAPNQWLDLTSATNVQKFRTTGAKPVDLGVDGSTPTGTAPILYLKSAYSSLGTNSGTGGNFVVNGTLTSATAP